MEVVLKFLSAHAADIANFVAGVIVVVISIGIRYLKNSSKVPGIVKEALEKLESKEVLAETVLSISKEYANDFKEAAEDGKLTAEEAARLRKLAVDRIKVKVGNKAISLLHKHFGDVEQLITDKVESFLLIGQQKK